MRYLSLFSGIEAATMAWHDLGFEPVGFSEIEPFPCAVLAHHYPDTPNLGDVTKITEEQIKSLGKIDIVVFGSPCQDLSVAGKRRGFKDEDGNDTRSGLFTTAIRIIRWARVHCGCRFALWENVPGAFSSSKGADFAEVVKLMAGLDDLDTPKNGWGTEGAAVGDNGLLEWAVLDAQWFGVAQRRKRVFAIADFGDWTSRQPILLERESLRGDTAPSREAGKSITHATAPCLTSSGRGVSRTGDTRGQDPVVAARMVAFGEYSVDGTASTMKSRDYKDATYLVAYGLPGNWIGRKPENGGNAVEPMVEVSPCQTKTDRHAVAFTGRGGGSDATVEFTPTMRSLSKGADGHQSGSAGLSVVYRTNASGQVMDQGEIAAALNRFTDPTAQIINTGMQVRRLTPVECARLQGFPDNFLDIEFKGKPAADGNKYKAFGNSMAVPVMRWIGERIKSTVEMKS